jgi:predicted site-specific integrase-resolvase
MDTKFLTPEQLVERWERLVNVKTLANWRHTGDGPAYIKIGGKIGYPLEDVKEYEKQRMRKPFLSR